MEGKAEKEDSIDKAKASDTGEPEKPVARESLEIAEKAIKSFAAALTNIRLFPPGSQQIATSTERAHSLIVDAVEAFGHLVFGE